MTIECPPLASRLYRRPTVLPPSRSICHDTLRRHSSWHGRPRPWTDGLRTGTTFFWKNRVVALGFSRQTRRQPRGYRPRAGRPCHEKWPCRTTTVRPDSRFRCFNRILVLPRQGSCKSPAAFSTPPRRRAGFDGRPLRFRTHHRASSHRIPDATRETGSAHPQNPPAS